MNRVQKKTIRGLETWYLEYPSSGNEILFFLHGFPECPRTWQNQIDFFKEDYHIVAPYLRGSEGVPLSVSKNRFELDAILLDFLAILKLADSSGLKKVHIVCHDISGPIGWEFAFLLGKRCTSLIAINAPSFQMLRRLYSYPRQVLKSSYIAFFQIPLISDLLTPLFIGKFIEVPPQIDLKKFHLYYRIGLRVLLSRRQFKRLKCPVLLIWGNEDPYLEIPSETIIRENAESFEIKVLRGGHWLQRTHADKINSEIKKHFDQIKDTHNESNI